MSVSVSQAGTVLLNHKLMVETTRRSEPLVSLSLAFLWRRLRKRNGLNPTTEQATPRRSHTRLCALPASNTASFRPVDSCPLPLTITEWNILSEAIASSHFLLYSESKLNRFLQTNPLLFFCLLASRPLARSASECSNEVGCLSEKRRRT